METSDRIVRPANLAPGAPGRQFVTFESANGVQVAVLSLLGRIFMRVLSAMTTSVPTPFDVADGDCRFCGIITEVDSATGRARSIERLRISGDSVENQ